jgi:predicted PurR-regulated permease PerM
MDNRLLNIAISLITLLLVVSGFFVARFINESTERGQYLINYINDRNTTLLDIEIEVKRLNYYLMQIEEIKTEQAVMREDINQIKLELERLKAQK